MQRVTDKSDKGQIVAYLNQEMVRHIAFTKTKKGDQDPKVMDSIEKFEGKELQMVDENNISTYQQGKSISEVVEMLV